MQGFYIRFAADVRRERAITDEPEVFGLSTERLQLPVTELGKMVNGAGLEGQVRSSVLDMLACQTPVWRC